MGACNSHRSRFDVQLQAGGVAANPTNEEGAAGGAAAPEGTTVTLLSPGRCWRGAGPVLWRASHSEVKNQDVMERNTALQLLSIDISLQKM